MKYIALLVLALVALSCSRRSGWPLEGGGLQHDIFISSRNDHSVKHYDGRTGDFLGDFIAPGEHGLQYTQDVAFGPDGYLYVSGRGNSAVQRYDSRTGAFLGDFTKGYSLDNPTKITFGPDGLLYVSQWGERQSAVARFNASTGVFVDEYTENLNQPLGHTWDKAGHFYVACFGSKEVRRYDGLRQFRGAFTEEGRLNGPSNLWFGDDGKLYVADWPTGRILRFHGDNGAYEGVFVEGLQRVEGVAFGPDGHLYACDWQAGVIRRYHGKTGALIDTFISSGGLQQPNAIVFRP